MPGSKPPHLPQFLIIRVTSVSVGSMSTAVVKLQWILRVVAVCSVVSLSLGKSSLAVDYIHYDYQCVNYTMVVYSHCIELSGHSRH